MHRVILGKPCKGLYQRRRSRLYVKPWVILVFRSHCFRWEKNETFFELSSGTDATVWTTWTWCREFELVSFLTGFDLSFFSVEDAEPFKVKIEETSINTLASFLLLQARKMLYSVLLWQHAVLPSTNDGRRLAYYATCWARRSAFESFGFLA